LLAAASMQCMFTCPILYGPYIHLCIPSFIHVVPAGKSGKSVHATELLPFRLRLHLVWFVGFDLHDAHRLSLV